MRNQTKIFYDGVCDDVTNAINEIHNSRGADFSADKTHRFRLWRTWDRSKPLILFVGLNPSDADKFKDDRTIKRLINFTKSWGYGGFYIVNIFSIISSKPVVLKKFVSDPNTKDVRMFNQSILLTSRNFCEEIVFMWGANKQAKEGSRNIDKIMPNAKCFGKNKDGSPIHPLYLDSKTTLIKF